MIDVHTVGLEGFGEYGAIVRFFFFFKQKTAYEV